MEPACLASLGREVQLDLESAGLVQRVVSPCGHSRTLPSAQASSLQGPFPRAEFCCLVPSGGTTAPSATLLATADFPGRTGYTAACFRLRRAREGFSSSDVHPLVVPLPLSRRVLRGCASKLFTPSMAFAVTPAARLPLVPFRGALTGRQDSLHATDRPVAPPNGACDVPLRRQAFPPDAGNLLPGALALTRTGLAPVGGHQLTPDSSGDRGSHPPSVSCDPQAAGHAVRP